jgi:uncharacterized repeat protein (TIGR03803 family)
VAGGASGNGTVFSLTADGEQTVLHNFTGGVDGRNPYAGLVQDTTGAFYGTAQLGGALLPSCLGGNGCGVVFRLDITSGLFLAYKIKGGTDGANPFASVLIGRRKNIIYGTTEFGGGSGCSGGGCGTVFRLDQTGETVLHRFTGGSDGAFPDASLVKDAEGNLYGTAASGGFTGGVCGSQGCGVVFRLSPGRQETVLYSFLGGADGSFPSAGLVRDSAGTLYGTTQVGGGSSSCFSGCGTVFKIDATGKETVLYTFTGGPDGAYPVAGLIRDATGNLYGTTIHGGDIFGDGTVFKVDNNSNLTVLHTFAGADGFSPYGGLARGKGGRLYGTTLGGGTFGYGTVFQLTPP